MARALLLDLIARRGITESGAWSDLLLRSLAAVIASAADASSAAVLLRDRQEPSVLRLHTGIGRLDQASEGVIPIDDTLVGSVFQSERPLRVGTLASAEGAGPGERQTGIGPALLSPLSAHGDVVGVLLLGRDPGADPFQDHHTDLVSRFAPVTSDVLGSLTPAPPRASASLAAGRELMNTLRHEVNNPLAIIMGQAQILSRDPTISHDAYLAKSMEAILVAAERVRAVLRGLTREDERGSSRQQSSE